MSSEIFAIGSGIKSYDLQELNVITLVLRKGRWK